jgi:hypothetical protein
MAHYVHRPQRLGSSVLISADWYKGWLLGSYRELVAEPRQGRNLLIGTLLAMAGAGQLSIFAGYSIYLPELFGSKVRSTGVSFAYNLGRFAAAAGSFFSAILTTRVFAAFAPPAPLRYSAITMCAVFLVGLGAALFAPETKGKPLPA